MKKILSLVLGLVAAVCFMLPVVNTAEAARVAIIPLQQTFKTPEETENNSNTSDYSIMYWDLIVEKFKFPAFDLVNDDTVGKALPAGYLQSYDKATLEKIATDTEADIVIAMRLDQLDSKPLAFHFEPTMRQIMKGEYASLNKVTGKYFHKKIDEQNDVEEVLTARGNWKHELFSKTTKRLFDKTLARR